MAKSSAKKPNLGERRAMQATLEDLRSIRGNGTSLISIFIPPTHGQQQRAKDLLKKEICACQSIKDQSVRSAVKNALVCAQLRFRTLTSSDFMPNGIALFVGEDIANNGKMCVHAMKPIRSAITSLNYCCGKEFNLSILENDLCDSAEYGIVCISGEQALIGTVCGQKTKILYSKSVKLPKKHCKGGQSQGRFNRLRL